MVEPTCPFVGTEAQCLVVTGLRAGLPACRSPFSDPSSSVTANPQAAETEPVDRPMQHDRDPTFSGPSPSVTSWRWARFAASRCRCRRNAIMH